MEIIIGLMVGKIKQAVYAYMTACFILSNTGTNPDFIRETQISKTECPDESGCKLNELSEAIS